jgi:hypothetical protein
LSLSLVSRVAAVALLAVVIATPAVASEIVDDPLPAPGETVFVPAKPFLDRIDTSPDFLEALVERVRDFKRYMRRRLAQIEVRLGEEEVPALASGATLDPEDAKRDAEMRVTDALDPEYTGLATVDADVIARTYSIGLHDSAQLAYDAPEDPSAGTTRLGSSNAAGLLTAGQAAPVPADAAPWNPIVLALDVLRWIRKEPLVTMLILSGIVFFAWARHAGARQS